MAGQSKNKAQYMEIAEKREQTQRKKEKGIVLWAEQLEESNNNAINKSAKQKKTIQANNDSVMRKIVKQLKAIEQEQADQLNKFGGAQARHNWSDVFSRRNGVYALLLEIIQRTRKKRLRLQIQSKVNKIIKRIQIIGIELSDKLRNIPHLGDSETAWKRYDAEIRGQLTKHQRSMHMRQRVRWRMNMRKLKKERDEQRKNNMRTENITIMH